MPRAASDQRTRILMAAVGVFAADGLEGATIRRVGRAAHVNSALIYYYFENKHDLFTEAIRFVLRGFLEHLAARRRTFRGARARMAFLVDGLFDYYSAHPERMRLMVQAINLHPDLLGRAVNAAVQAGSAIIPFDVLAEGMKAGELRAVHPRQAWMSILGMCLFSLLFRGVSDHLDATPIGRVDVAARRLEILDLLMDGFAVRRKPLAGRQRKKRAG